jgi:guanine deaminase
MSDETFLKQAVDLAVANVADGGGPFGAVVVRDGIVVATGQNRVTRDLDPSAHAEVSAIRAACKALGTYSLEGATLYTSCEPCPMCLATSLWARLDRVVYAADRDDAAAGGFDDRRFYELFGDPGAVWPTLVEAGDHPGSFRPFSAWLANEGRTAY